MGIRTTPPFRVLSLVPGGPADSSGDVQVVSDTNHKEMGIERSGTIHGKCEGLALRKSETPYI
jgi:hypothetical protein